MARCDSYFRHGFGYRCFSTEHPAECLCGGDQSKCDFFPEKREPKLSKEKIPIDANALERLRYTHIVQYWDGKLLKSLPLSEAPTVDTVEVVRCKDCVHMKNQFNARFCNVWCMYNGMGDEGYCNYGERRPDNG